MAQATFRPSEEVISSILNMVCPECGGSMGGRAEEFKCQGRCRTDWRMVWEDHLTQDSALSVSADAGATSVDAHCSRGPNVSRRASARRGSRRHSCQSRSLESFKPRQAQGQHQDRDKDQQPSQPWWSTTVSENISQN